MRYIPRGMTFKEYEEKYITRHLVNTVALAYLIMLGFEIAWEFFAIKWLAALGISLNFLGDMLRDPATMLLINVLITSVMFTIPFIAVTGREGERPSTLLLFGRPEKGTFFPLLAMGFGACMAANVAASYISEIFGSIGIKNRSVFETMPSGFFGIAVAVLSISFAPALLEEFALRGVAMGLLRKLGDGFAIFVSAAFFAIMHLNMGQIPFAFLVGIVLGFAYIKSGSFWTGAAIHALNNLTSLALDYLLNGASQSISDLINILLLAGAIVIGFIGLFFYVRNGGNFTLNRKTTEFSGAKRTSWVISSPLVIAAFAASLLLMLIV